MQTTTAIPQNAPPGSVATLSRPVAFGSALAFGGTALIAGVVVLGLPPAIAFAAGAAGAALLWCALLRPMLVLLLVVMSEIANISGVAADLGVPGVFQALFFFVVVALASTLRSGACRRRLGARVWWCVALLLAYLTTQFLSVAASSDVVASVEAIDERAIDCAFVTVILLLTVATDSRWRVAAAITAPLAALSLLSLLNLVLLDGATDLLGLSIVTEATGELTTTVRFGGPLPDSNFWGRHLVLGFPVAAALALRAHTRGRRGMTTLWAAAALLLPVGMYLTQSRGTYLAAVVSVIVFVLLADRAIRLRAVWLIPAGVPLLLLPGIGDRFVSLLADLRPDSGTTGVDPSVLGRSAAQEIAWRMFTERPLTGYGIGTYSGHVRAYADRVSTSVAEPTDAAHNLYAELLAESGIIGLAGWLLLVVGISYLVFARLRHTSAVTDQRLAAAVLAAIVAWSLASVFLHLAYFRTFGVLLALAVAVCAFDDRSPREGLHRRRTRRTSITRVVPAAVLAIAVSSGSAILLSRDDVAATQPLVVIPRGSPDTLSAWPMDVHSRQTVMPTFAALFESGATDVQYIGDPVRGVVTIELTARDTATATAMLSGAEASARERLAAFGMESNFRVVSLGPPVLSERRTLTPSALVGSTIAAVGTLAAAWFALMWRERRTS